MLRVVDVSSHNGNVNWAALAADGVQGAIIKVTEGTDYRNPYYKQQRDGARSVGFVVGHYHYFRPSVSFADSEAAYFISQADVQSGEIVVNDVEDTNVSATRDLTTPVHGWASSVQGTLRTVPWFYSGWWYMLPHRLYGSPEMARYPLWYASYQDDLPPTPAGWDRITCWQHTSKKEIGGNFFDESFFYGTVEDWKAMGVPVVDGQNIAIITDVRQWAINAEAMLDHDKSQGAWVVEDFETILLPALDRHDYAKAIEYLNRLTDWCADLSNTFVGLQPEIAQQIAKLRALSAGG